MACLDIIMEPMRHRRRECIEVEETHRERRRGGGREGGREGRGYLEIAMEDVGGVHVLERAQDLLGDKEKMEKRVRGREGGREGRQEGKHKGSRERGREGGGEGGRARRTW